MEHKLLNNSAISLQILNRITFQYKKADHGASGSSCKVDHKAEQHDKFIKIRGLILAQLKARKTSTFQCARNNLAYGCDTMPEASKQRGH